MSSNEAAQLDDRLRIGASAPLLESIRWSPSLTIRRYSERVTELAERAVGQGRTITDEMFAVLGYRPYDMNVTEGNLLTTAGLGRIATLINAGTGNLIASTTARVGAGNSATAEAIGQTDLQAAAGSTNRWFQTCTVTIPSNVWTFAASFGTADGNFTWAEWCIDVGTATVSSSNAVSAVMLNRKVAANGTKASGQTWTATATITLS